MSLVGFDHVFGAAQPVQFAPGLTLKVIPPSALILLKIVAFIEDQQRRPSTRMSAKSHAQECSILNSSRAQSYSMLRAMAEKKTERSNCRFTVQQAIDGKHLLVVQLYQDTIPMLKKVLPHIW
jgi:hypothetical protein